MGGLTHLFPTPTAFAELAPGDLCAPARRVATFTGLAAALASGDLNLDIGADRAEARAALAAVRGIGAWTVEMIAMRSLGDPDAFPATDLGLKRAAAKMKLDVAAASFRWRTWRAYATQYL